MRCTVPAATSGQAVLISGVTVLIAMAGMLLAGNGSSRRSALGAMIVVFVSHRRLADRARRRCSPSSATGSTAGGCRSLGRRRAATASRASGARARPRRCATRSSRLSLSAGGPARRSPCPALGMHTKLLELHRPAAEPADRRGPTTTSRRRSPARRRRREVVVKAPNVTHARSSRSRSPTSQSARSPPASCSQPIRRASTPTTRSRRSTSRSPATARTRAPSRALQHPARRRDPATLGRLPGAEFAVTGETAGTPTSTTR